MFFVVGTCTSTHRFAWQVGPVVYHGELCHAATSTPKNTTPPSTSSPSSYTTTTTNNINNRSSFGAAAAASTSHDTTQQGDSSAQQGDSSAQHKQQPGEGVLRRVGVVPLVADAAVTALQGGVQSGTEGDLLTEAVDELEELSSMVRVCCV